MTESQGPIGWRNWRAAGAGDPREGTFELVFYTDAHITGGNFSIGPFEVLNTVASGGPIGNAQPGIVLRVDNHLPREVAEIDWSKTSTDLWHGGWIGARRTPAVFWRLHLGFGVATRAGCGSCRGR